MGVAIENISLVRGDTYRERFVVTDLLGVPIDLTGAKLYYTIKTNYEQPDPGVLQLTSPTSGITIVDAPNGVAELTITASQTDVLQPMSYLYDMQIKLQDGTIATLVSGTLTVLPDVTRTVA